MSTADFALADAIVELRRALKEAQETGVKERLKFRVEDVEVEFSVTTTTEKEGNAGIRFWVVNADASATRGTGKMHTLRLRLKPLDDGRPFDVAGEGDGP